MTTLPLDQDFPQPILAAIYGWLGDVDLAPIGHIDNRLTDLGDRELVLALYQLGYPGLVTNNYRMLQNPVELAAVIKTELSIIAIEGLGDDPIRATGALLLNLSPIVKAIKAGRTGVFWLHPRAPQPKDPWALLEELAGRRDEDVDDLYRQVAVSDDELTTPILDSADQ